MDRSIQHNEQASVNVNGIEIVYDSFGDPSSPPMLLIMGLGAQMIAWDEDFCSELASHGYCVIRFDNRDVGLSTKLDEAGLPNMFAMLRSQMQGETVEAPYTLRDMADDVAGLLDGLEINAAHIVGASMGGMIGQEMAIRHPQRVLTLTSIMSSTGNPELPPPKPEALTVLVTPPPSDKQAYIEYGIEAWKILSGPGYPPDDARTAERAGRFFDRGLSPAGTSRQMAAILASESRKEALQSVKAPALVIHGDSDPLVPVEGGIETADSIPGAELLIIEGMGHDLPPSLAPQIIEAIVGHAK
jgi:pimeloyl-ACP methyl ester carboxylesterase